MNNNETFGVSLSGPDLASLFREVVEAASYARGIPSSMSENLVQKLPVENWVELAIGSSKSISAAWGNYRRITWNIDTVVADFPDVSLQAEPVARFLSRFSFEVAVLAITDAMMNSQYTPPAISGGHALLGWGMALKGAGHERSLVSRRWLEHGPWRTIHGPNDTTLVQFHDLIDDPPAVVEQAIPGHETMVAGYLRPKHIYEHDVKGIYTAEDQLLRVVVVDRDVSTSEMTDACAARRDGRNDTRKPIANVAFIFLDADAARRHLHELWLRELECRLVEDGVERRLDADYRPTIQKPMWVEGLR